MKKSAAVTVGLVLVAGMSFACGTGEDEGEEICVERATMVRAEWEECENDQAHITYHPFFVSSSRSVPSVGSKVDPASGGFGLHGGTVSG